MFSFFKKKTQAEPAPATAAPEAQDERSWREKLGFGAPKPAAPEPVVVPPAPVPDAAAVEAVAEPAPAERKTWLDKLKSGLRKTGSSITQVFTGTRIDEALYEELEAALLMADAGVKATQFLLYATEAKIYSDGDAGWRTKYYGSWTQ